MRRLYINWKKVFIITTDVVLAVYLVLAVTSWNNPDRSEQRCTKVNISVEDGETDGFLSAKEVKRFLTNKEIYPLHQYTNDVDVREIQDVLIKSPFIEKASCYKTENGNVNISISQRTPIIRIKSDNGADYYVDNKGGVMPKTNYSTNLIVATGNISSTFARKVLGNLANYIVHDDFWRNQVVQINVLADHSIELVPRVGDHIIYIGQATDIESKLDRMYKFYKYGLSQAGWNKYKYISVEFANQIICKK